MRLTAQNPARDTLSSPEVGRPLDLCGAHVFLASDASTQATSQNPNIDGGWTAV